MRSKASPLSDHETRNFASESSRLGKLAMVQASAGLMLCALGFALLFFASGCEDGCVRNSDCAEGFECSEALCVLKEPQGGMDASMNGDEDAGN